MELQQRMVMFQVYLFDCSSCIHEKAEYFTHCRNHALNLTIVASVPDTRNFMETMKVLTLFFILGQAQAHTLRAYGVIK